jgi:hypothetical protein
MYIGGDSDFYEQAVQIGSGARPISKDADENVDEVYTSYVQRGKVAHVEKPRKDLESFYDRWLHGAR